MLFLTNFIAGSSNMQQHKMSEVSENFNASVQVCVSQKLRDSHNFMSFVSLFPNRKLHKFRSYHSTQRSLYTGIYYLDMHYISVILKLIKLISIGALDEVYSQ
jgi:hypothetical protein